MFCMYVPYGCEYVKHVHLLVVAAVASRMRIWTVSMRVCMEILNPYFAAASRTMLGSKPR